MKALTAAAGLLASAAPAAASDHPLDAPDAEEIRQVVAILSDGERVGPGSRFAELSLAEADKSLILAWKPGQPFERRIKTVVLQDGATFEGIVNLTTGLVERWENVPGVHPRVMFLDMGPVEALRADGRWRQALAQRGLDPDHPLMCAPLAPGPVSDPELLGRRLLFISCYDVSQEGVMAFARPVENLMGVVDVDSREVVRIVDLGPVPLAPDPASLRYDRAAQYRQPVKPVVIAAPQGSNIEIAGSLVQWDNWSFHLRLDPREGTVVSRVRYDDHGVERDVLYRLSASEMFVPYMDPAPTWSFKAYMDLGEYGFGLLASPLQRGSDCPEGARYLDATVASDEGEPVTLRDAVCLFERPTGGPLWRHVEPGDIHSRPEVELVVRMAPVVGNYDYLVDYVFSRNGGIGVRAGAAGIDAVKGVASGMIQDATAMADTAVGTLIAPGLVGVNHDHFISFRVDADIDGMTNRAVFDEVRPELLDEANPRRSLWRYDTRTIQAEGPLRELSEAGYVRIESTTKQNLMGYPTSYQLYPGHSVTSLLAPGDPIQRRAAWSRYQVWLSRFAPGEMYASGDYPNMDSSGDGLARWTADAESIDGQDVVLWYTLGFRHITRAEDWPAMPTVWHGFDLRPFNFFDRNPAMDVVPLERQDGDARP